MDCKLYHRDEKSQICAGRRVRSPREERQRRDAMEHQALRRAPYPIKPCANSTGVCFPDYVQRATLALAGFPHRNHWQHMIKPKH